MGTSHRLGRLHRTFDPRIPHLSALLAGKRLPPPPPQVDWTRGMPGNLGVMLNDKLGDCTCAAVYHALQLWSFNASGAMLTEPDADVLELYEKACGYDPKVPGEGPGGIEQQVLTYLYRHGAPMGPDGKAANRISAFVEVDTRLVDDVKRTIHECGVAYIGFHVPNWLVPDDAPPPKVWDVRPEPAPIVGGHCVLLAGYDDQGARVISWGEYFTMTWAFFAQYADEAYAIADKVWVGAKGTTPGGLTLAELEAQMKALAESEAIAAPG